MLHVLPLFQSLTHWDNLIENGQIDDNAYNVSLLVTPLEMEYAHCCMDDQAIIFL